MQQRIWSKLESICYLAQWYVANKQETVYLRRAAFLPRHSGVCSFHCDLVPKRQRQRMPERHHGGGSGGKGGGGQWAQAGLPGTQGGSLTVKRFTKQPRLFVLTLLLNLKVPECSNNLKKNSLLRPVQGFLNMFTRSLETMVIWKEKHMD